MQNTCCFTGHGCKGLPWGDDENDIRCVAMKALLRELIEGLIREEGIRHFVSGMARGADTYAAEIVLALKKDYDVTLECVLPCGEQAALWSGEERERYGRILEEADRATLEM